TRVPIRRHIDPALIGRLRGILRQQKPDIVHTHLIHADLHGTLAARLAGVRRVITSRHNDNNFRRSLPMQIVNRLLWRMTDSGIAISGAIAQFCVEAEGAPATKLTTIHYGLPLAALDRKRAQAALRSELNIAPDALLVGMVCRLIEQKGVVYGLRGFAQVAAQF